MLGYYRRLAPKEKALVWVAVIAGVVWIFGWGGIVAGAQVTAALGTLALAVLAFRQVEELRATRIAQERPQVIVDADYEQSQIVHVVVRNIGRGAAKDISFEFSAPMESPRGRAPINELPYFRRGLDYLAPGAEISCVWTSMIGLPDFLEARGLHDGITITTRYRGLADTPSDEPYKSSWTINPLLLVGKGYLAETGLKEVVGVLEKFQKDFHKVVNAWPAELKVSTETEREERRRKMDEEGDDDE
jgi:hypothetical protein